MATNHLSHHPSYSWVWSSAPAMADHPRCFNLLEQQEPRRERMFEKPLTPSDVGKLNRLVIPKQHAEKHFPLDADAGEKGLLLTFEDDAGKPWRFRYSYWTSSQSYVLTKGWSRFVKDNRLDAGDVVLFDRLHTSSADRLFIGCRRRRAGGEPAPPAAAPPLPWAPPAAPIPYLYGGSAPASPGEQLAAAAAAAAEGSSRRRLRLFGVNLECGPDRPEPMASDYSYN